MDSDAGSATNLPAMFRCKPLAVAVFAMWTLLVWAKRIYNIVAKDGGDGVDLARAIGFVVVGLVVAVVACDRCRRRSPTGWCRWPVGPRSRCGAAHRHHPLGDYSVGFVVVHLVLVAISISLVLWAMRSTRSLAVVDGAVHGDPDAIIDYHRPSTGTDVVDPTTTLA